jgi:putative transposase
MEDWKFPMAATTAVGRSLRYRQKLAQKSRDALLPILYPRGVSTGGFQEARCPPSRERMCQNLSPAVIARLSKEWQADYGAWQKRNPLPRRVREGGRGLYLQARIEESVECMLGADWERAQGRREFLIASAAWAEDHA